MPITRVVRGPNFSMGLAYKALCPSCNEGLMVSDRYSAERALPGHCDVCGKDVCQECIIYEPHSLVRGMQRKMLNDHMPCRDACCMCIEKVELDYIAELPIEELPLIISWNWISKTAGDALKARLAAGRKAL